MAPIKFEENIKDKLDKRTLQPSTEAWNKLSERLDEQEKKGNNKTIWWIGLAASIVGVLFVVSQFFNNNTAQKIVPQVVDTPQVETILEQEHKNQIAEEDIIRNTVVEDAKIIKESRFKNPKNVIAITNDNIIVEDKVVAQENISPELNIETNKSIAIVPEKLTFEEETIQNVVEQIQKLQEQNKEGTDEAIDALLLQAQKEITLKKLYNESTGVVDADLLLQDVEADLDRSFRTKVFETLKASYNTVKTAVAQRNN